MKELEKKNSKHSNSNSDSSSSSDEEEEKPKHDEKIQVLENHVRYYERDLRDPGIEGRKASRIYFLRSFNNWVKACLIKKYTFKIGRNVSVLDLCCGRGGDLPKYFQSRVKIYVGSDIAEELLQNAMDRLEKITQEKFSGNNTKCFLIQDDLSSPTSVLLKKIPDQVFFDIVACQFALHYHFETEDKIRKFLSNVVAKLNPGGFFFGTIIDADVLVKRLRSIKNKENFDKNPYNDKKFTFGNEYYSVQFAQKRFPINKPYGIRYGFYLEDSIDKKDKHGNVDYIWEYLIIFKLFVELAKEYELDLVENFNFENFYENNVINESNEDRERTFNLNLFKKMIKLDHEKLSTSSQWDIIQLYKVFCFRKIPKGKTMKDYERYTAVHDKTQFNFDNKPELKIHKMV